MPHSSLIVTFAVPQESREFRLALRRMDRGDIQVEHIGVGPAAAAARMSRLIADEKPRLVICTGFAGGLDPRLAIGDLVVAENLSTPEWVARIRSEGSEGSPERPPAFGAVVSRALPVESVADKTALARETGALAVDMESEAVAEACRAAAVPLLVVRVISDPAGTPLPVPFGDWFDIVGQQPRVLGLLQYLACHPGRIGPFAHFVRGLAPARRAVADFLVHCIGSGGGLGRD